MNKKHFVYKTTNNVNGKTYIGVHSTKKLDDGYMGSGKILNQAIEKYGLENFTREILSFWDNREAALKEERRIVDPLDPMCYNLVPGGQGGHLSGGRHPLFGSRRLDSSARMQTNNPSKLDHVRKMLKSTSVGVGPDGTGRYAKDDPRWTTGEIVHINKGKITAKDKDGNFFHVTKDDPRWTTGEIVHSTKGLPRTQAQIIKPLHTCPKCGKQGRGGTMLRWHFENCKF